MQIKRKIYTVCLTTIIFSGIFIFSLNALAADACNITVKTKPGGASDACTIEISTKGECDIDEVKIKTDSAIYGPYKLKLDIPSVPKKPTYTIIFMPEGEFEPKIIELPSNSCISEGTFILEKK